ncbi:hypothetical protein J1605_022892 [Eschrichtius robustus]|uniref:Uncharacterized protein n=1 Tax=Eschrichtius robustus TaxID=9764 RepID=A0AB34H474_ESCRO|nr:hypothetical protein J1605_022892 [Eschrichtius robustus]
MQGTPVRSLVREDPTCCGANVIKFGYPIPALKLPQNNSKRQGRKISTFLHKAATFPTGLLTLTVETQQLGGTSLVAQWLRIRLPVQGTQVRALVWEDPTCHGATKPVHHNY